MFLFVLTAATGQKKYDQKVQPSTLTLEGISINGHKTNFDFDREYVRKGWWAYARKFGSPLNMKDYYKVTIPASQSDGNVDMTIYTQTVKDANGVSFFLGVADKALSKQATELLLDFKKHFYIHHYLDEMEQLTDEANALSKDYRKAILDTKKRRLLDQLSQIKYEIEGLIDEVRKVEKNNF